MTNSIIVSPRISIVPQDVQITTASGSQDEIVIPIVSKIVKNIAKLKEDVAKLVEQQLNAIIHQFDEQYNESLGRINQNISTLDVLMSKVYIAKKYKYCRPTIDETQEKAFVRTRELRHCLIEQIQQSEIYVPNDLDLGMSDETRGILLYGTNAVGKTSLIRALGIAVIMAQSGMYVPCTEFVYKPYTAIYSRILGNDNLFRGLSTFAVEMSELRIILKMSDKNSLILGDELCSGTETESALSIFMAGLVHLYRNQSSFIFATHFHEITRYDEMREMDKIRIAHMAVSYNRELDCLVYDRIIRDGQGTQMYGLEVCRSLYLPDDFLEMAYQIRCRYNPKMRGALSHPTTTYNSNKIRGVCEMCGNVLGTETHHIMPQSDAGGDGFIGTVQKNHPANLMSVCGNCHDSFHNPLESSAEKVNRRKKTTRGIRII
jgi:DNA mismatch repair protein MutS